MNVGAGKILMSTTLMDDLHFKNSILFITEYNSKGAMAFVINKIYERSLNELAEFSSSTAFPLYNGGPVDNEHLFFIHCRPGIIPGGEKILGDIYSGGDFSEAIQHINNKTIDETAIKICVGYCGWDAGELEAEIEQGCWELMQADAEIIFTKYE